MTERNLPRGIALIRNGTGYQVSFGKIRKEISFKQGRTEAEAYQLALNHLRKLTGSDRLRPKATDLVSHYDQLGDDDKEDILNLILDNSRQVGEHRILTKYVNVEKKVFGSLEFRGLIKSPLLWYHLITKENEDGGFLLYDELNYHLTKKCDIPLCIREYDIRSSAKRKIPFEERTRADYVSAEAFLASHGIRDEKTGCFLWIGPRDPKGYGAAKKWGSSSIHRFAYQVYHGITLSKKEEVCHVPLICFHRHCYHKEHLMIGSRSDNIEHTRIAGTMIRGADHHWKKIDDSIIKEVKQEIQEGKKILSEIAREKNISVSTVCNIKNYGKTAVRKKGTKAETDTNFT